MPRLSSDGRSFLVLTGLLLPKTPSPKRRFALRTATKDWKPTIRDYASDPKSKLQQPDAFVPVDRGTLVTKHRACVVPFKPKATNTGFQRLISHTRHESSYHGQYGIC